MTRAAMWWVAALASAAVACNGSSGVTTPTGPSAPSATQGSVQDRAGDAVAAPGFTPTPDLVDGTLQVGTDTVVVTVQFAPGSYDAATTWVQALLDTDESATSGLRGVGPGPEDDELIGADYWLDYAARGYTVNRSSLARCTTNDAATCREVARPTVTVTGDRLEWRFARTSIADDDGRMRVKFSVFSGRSPETPSDDHDTMPDIGLPAASVR